MRYCVDVQTEPQLLPSAGEQLPSSTNTAAEARLDFSVRNFWIKEDRVFFYVLVFNPYASPYLNQKLQSCFDANEREKKRTYNHCVINIDHGSFTPCIFTPYGGSSRETE